MSKYDQPEILCLPLTVFITEIREQAAAIRAYDNTFLDRVTDNVFLQRAYTSMWRELLSEISRTFDNANTGSNENCTISRLKDLCLKEQYTKLFPDGEKDNLLQALDEVLESYRQLPIRTSRNKQLSHHDIKQLFEGEAIAISLEQVEGLIANTTDIFAKIYTRLCCEVFDITFPDYDVLVETFERELKQLV